MPNFIVELSPYILLFTILLSGVYGKFYGLARFNL
jgi:hypothetical protein